MEHLVTIAFDFDDKTVSEKIEKTVEKTVIDKITKEAENKVFRNDSWSSWNRREVDPEKDPLSAWTENIVRDIFLHYKDEVIAKAAEIVADKFKRTKAWKEAAGGAMKGETKNG